MSASVCNADLVIISTKEKMDAVDWGQYVLKHWNRLFSDRGKLLVLAGIHGNDTNRLRQDLGSLGRMDREILEDCKEQLEVIRKQRRSDIRENNIEILDVTDASQYCLETEVGHGHSYYRFNENSILETIKASDPTVVVLAFCFSFDGGQFPSGSCHELTKVLNKNGYINGRIVSSTYCKEPPIYL